MITVAAGFPTTVNPILQNGLVPVFVDVDLRTYNIDCGPDRGGHRTATRAIMLAHTLGNPSTVARSPPLAEKHDLWLIEDCCDALGSTYDGQLVGTFGDSATVRFYPAHHITMGEGGCVFTTNARADADRRIVPRLGPRLLVRARARTTRAASGSTGSSATLPRLRPQVHLLAPRLQPEDHRHAGRRGT